ncbi:hypothetical protein KR038_008417, partial [Drosophila bunnanda]
KTAIAVMLIIQLTRSSTQSPNLEFLGKLFENNLTRARTTVILQHHEDRNCELQDWNRRETATLRLNQLARVEMKKYFNALSVGLVCIGKDSDLSLVDTLAEIFDQMRHVEVILWIQKEVTQEMLQRILHQAKRNEYLQILILEVSREQGEILSAHCFCALPNSQIVQVDKMAGFPKVPFDFTGRVANVLPDYDAIDYQSIKSNNLSQHFKWLNGNRHIILFAKKYNLTLKSIPSPRNDPSAFNVTPDILMTSQITSTKMDLKYLNPFDLHELKVVVPCRRTRTIRDILKQLDIKSSLLYILPVYATFVVVETIILMVTHRINGRAFQLTSLYNSLLNLRAIRAILGLSFPISRRANPSLRQLFLAISVFGLIFSNFFSCKLTAMLTKHSHYPKVTNFQELRASDLSVVVNAKVRAYIENEIDTNFFNETIIRIYEVSPTENARLLLLLNDSFAFIVVSDRWSALNVYQNSKGRKLLCESKDLTIIHGMPKMHILQKNSIYDWHISKFLLRIHESGISNHWLFQTPYFIHKILNTTLDFKPRGKEVPLRIADLNWLWLFLGCGYLFATFVFIIEITLRGLRKWIK